MLRQCHDLIGLAPEDDAQNAFEAVKAKADFLNSLIGGDFIAEKFGGFLFVCVRQIENQAGLRGGFGGVQQEIVNRLFWCVLMPGHTAGCRMKASTCSGVKCQRPLIFSP